MLNFIIFSLILINYSICTIPLGDNHYFFKQINEISYYITPNSYTTSKKLSENKYEVEIKPI